MKKYFLLLSSLFLILNCNGQTKYYYNIYLSPIGSYWIHSTKDSAEFYSNIDLDTINYGEATMYYTTGEVFARDLYDYGSFIGTKRYYKNGKKRYVMSSGTSQSSLENGATMKVFSLSTYVGVDNSWDSIGNKMVRQGTGYFENYYNNGKLLCEGEYEKGASVGEWRGYYQNGNFMYQGRYTGNYHGWLIQTICSIDGDTLVKNGTGYFILYYPNGKVSAKGRYSSGTLSGEFIMYHPNGKLKEKSMMVHGWRDGLFESYYENGNLACTGKFTNGRKIGEWKWYDKNGKEIRYKKFEFLH